MINSTTRVRQAAIAAVLIMAIAAAAAQGSLQADADSMREKLEFIVEFGERPRSRPAPPVRTAFTESEINAYLTVYGAPLLPSGIADPSIRIGEGGLVTARAIVDLDAVRKSRQRAWRDPLAYATGSLEVVASGFVSSADGVGVAQFESVTLAGLGVPKGLLDELIQFYTASPERPQGFGLDTPFELPANIRSVRLEPGRATVTQ
jgi:hypothetical protein